MDILSNLTTRILTVSVHPQAVHTHAGCLKDLAIRLFLVFYRQIYDLTTGFS